jgi:hypothetical protein
MNPEAQAILEHLRSVNHERERRRAEPGLAERVSSLKSYQQARFSRTHADLLADPEQRDAARFFLNDLYGPQDFAQRDAQFARVVPTLDRLFPVEVVWTVARLAALHALTEHLDTEMAHHLPTTGPNAGAYLAAWQSTGRAQERDRQVDLMVSVAGALDQYTRKPLLRQGLRMMRAPARAAGLTELQSFLERGFDTFRELPQPGRFLDTIGRRERALSSRLFEAQTVVPAGPDDALGQLP